MYAPLDCPPLEIHQTPIIDLPGHDSETIYEVLAALKATDLLDSLKFSLHHLVEYLARGGEVNLVKQGCKIAIGSQELIITGCNAGRCRSQATAAFLKNLGLKVECVLAGRDSAMNPAKLAPNLRNPVASQTDADSFKVVFNQEKMPQLGFQFLENQGELIEEARLFYKNYMQNLSMPTHFLTFGMCAPVVLMHLIERSGSLAGFKITYFDWLDNISHRIDKHSVAAYASFVDQLQKHICLECEHN